jgi:uncharacterized membrane protein YvbJ
MKRRGVEMSMTLVITIVILLIALIVILFNFTDMFGKEKASVSSTITSVTADSDCDGVYNFYDKCPCDANVDMDAQGKCAGKNPDWCFQKGETPAKC